MPAITVQIMANVSNHVIVNQLKNARRYRNGDITNVRLSAGITHIENSVRVLNSPVGNSKALIFHIDDAPSNAKRLIHPGFKLSVIDINERIDLRRRKFNVNIGLLPVAQRTQLLADKQLMLTWAQFKSICRRKSVIVETNPDQDNFINLIDSDVA